MLPFKEISRTLLSYLDRLLPMEVRRQQGLPLLRARSLLVLLISVLVNILLMFSFGPLHLGNQFNVTPGMIVLSIFGLLATMRSRHHLWISTLYLAMTSLAISIHMIWLNSLFPAAMYCYPISILGGFLFCGRRIGFWLGLGTVIQSIVVLLILRNSWNPAPHLSWPQLADNYIVGSIFIPSLSCCLVGSYLWLIASSRQAYAQERVWLEKAESTRVLLQIAEKIARSANEPVEHLIQIADGLGQTALKEMQPMQWTSAILEIDQGLQWMHRFHHSFEVLTRSLFGEQVEPIDPKELADHVLALCCPAWDAAMELPIQIQADSASMTHFGRLSSIILLLVVLVQEVLERKLSPPAQVQIAVQNRNLQINFGVGFVDTLQARDQNSIGFVPDLCRALQAQFTQLPAPFPWRLSIPLKT